MYYYDALVLNWRVKTEMGMLQCYSSLTCRNIGNLRDKLEKVQGNIVIGIIVLFFIVLYVCI